MALRKVFQVSIDQAGTGKQAPSVFDDNDALAAFQGVCDRRRETCAIVWTDADEPTAFRNVAAVRGEIGKVAPPLGALNRALAKRVSNRATVLFLHNHPPRFGKKVNRLVREVLDSIGPSFGDRWYADEQIRKHPERNQIFWLLEDGEWRDFSPGQPPFSELIAQLRGKPR